MNPRRLYRSRTDRKLAGVAGGMAEYLEIDPTIVRVLWILSVFLGGFTILLYIILAFVMPIEPEAWPGYGAWQAPAGSGQPPEGGPATADPDSDTVAGGSTGPSAGAIPGWQPPGGGPWVAAGPWAAGPPPPAPERRPGRGGLYVGVALVVFGTIAALDVLVPGVASSGLLWAGLVIALGVALLVGSTRRGTVGR